MNEKYRHDCIIKTIRDIMKKIVSTDFPGTNAVLTARNGDYDTIHIWGKGRSKDTFEVSFYNSTKSVMDRLGLEEDNSPKVYTVDTTALAETIYECNYNVWLDGDDSKYDRHKFWQLQNWIFNLVNGHYLYGLERFYSEIASTFDEYDDDQEMEVSFVNWHYVRRIKRRGDHDTLTVGLYKIAAALDYELIRGLGHVSLIGPGEGVDFDRNTIMVSRYKDGSYSVESYGNDAKKIISDITSGAGTARLASSCYLYDVAKAIVKYDLHAVIDLND
jgi:hypothetical protein